MKRREFIAELAGAVACPTFEAVMFGLLLRAGPHG
jgi:hypothetical protein